MTSILDDLINNLQGAPMREINNNIGAGDEGQTRAAIGAALPVLLGALKRNAASPEGAQALQAALEDGRHDGSSLSDLTGLFGGGGQQVESEGLGILRHVLGSKQARVEQGIGQASGLDAGSIGKLLPMLAPVVMGMLGKKKREGGLDAGGLVDMLTSEEKQAEEKSSLAGGLITKFLDQDGDGDLDLGDLAKGLFGGLRG